jgi:hypothetical protein
MSSEVEHNIVKAASALRGSVNALKPSLAKTEMRKKTEALIAALAGAGFDLRVNYNLPPVVD